MSVCSLAHVRACVCVLASSVHFLRAEADVSVFFHFSPPYLFREGHSLNLELTDWPGQLTIELLGPPCLCLPRLGSQVYALSPAFHKKPRAQTQVLKPVKQALYWLPCSSNCIQIYFFQSAIFTCSSVVEHLPRMYKVLSSIPSTAKLIN